MHVFFGLQTVLPVVLLLWLAVRHPASRFDWAIGVCAVFGAIGAVTLAVPWVFVPAAARYGYLALGLVAGLRSWFRVRQVASGGRRAWRAVQRMAVVVLAVAGWAVAGLAVDGRRIPDGEVLDLRCPLGPGTYLVASGGSRQLVNAHLATLAPDVRFRPWRGQSYGVDFVQVDRIGRRASSGLMSPNPSDYLIYGQLVTAPCDGTVVAMLDDRPDMPVPMRDPDRSQLAGNHVILACGHYEVVLAHLQPGSLRVAVGESVQAGDLLGFAGNSGNSDEPHLHVSAQRRGTDQVGLGGDPIPITIEGVFPVRNDRIVCR